MSRGINDVEGNLEKQLDEVKALQAIYAEDFQSLKKKKSRVRIVNISVFIKEHEGNTRAFCV